MEPPILQICDLHKSFGTQKVLKGVSLSIAKGERVALLGANGAGKSTMVKLIAGDKFDFEGSILLQGKEHKPSSPSDAQRAGVTLMYQELETIPDLPVHENITMGNEPRRGPFVDHKKTRKIAKDALQRVGADIDPNALTGDLSPAEQQMVMLARAVHFDSKLLILDEPSALLTDPEINKLFAILDSLTARGVAILYISHRIQELFRLGGRIDVLRDGILSGSLTTDEATVPKLVQLMSGREPGAVAATTSAPTCGNTLLNVKNLSAPGINDISFELHAGEILGLGGLVGSGRTELLRALAGLDLITSGTIELRGEAFIPETPGTAIKAGIMLAPEDRKEEALFQDFSLARNVTATKSAEIAKAKSWITETRENQAATPALERAGVIPLEPSRQASTMSGGNQQKLVFARALFSEAEILLLDEPTRGVDVAAKEELFEMIRQLAANGKAILFVSSELEEVARISHRILVLHSGAQVTELTSPCTEDDILAAVLDSETN